LRHLIRKKPRKKQILSEENDTSLSQCVGVVSITNRKTPHRTTTTTTTNHKNKQTKNNIFYMYTLK
jgi:hypothetical protein